MDYYLGMIMPTAFSFAPKYSAMANGQLMPINQNQALYSLLGFQFGGDGSQNFKLPNLNGRTMIGFGTGGLEMPLGTQGGEETHTLSTAEIPMHTHPLTAASQGSAVSSPASALPGKVSASVYGPAKSVVPLGNAPMSTVGASQPHPNMQPYTALNFTIVLFGIYPTRN